MCKGYSWRVSYTPFDRAGKFDPIPDKWCDTLAEARRVIRDNGPMDRMPGDYDVIAEATPILDIPPMRTPRGVDIHYFWWTGRNVREFV